MNRFAGAIFALVSACPISSSAASLWIGGPHGIVELDTDSALSTPVLEGPVIEVRDLAVNAAGNVFAIVDFGTGKQVIRDGADLGVDECNDAQALAISPDQRLFLGCQSPQGIYEVDQLSGSLETRLSIASARSLQNGMAVDDLGDLYWLLAGDLDAFDDLVRNHSTLNLSVGEYDAESVSRGTNGSILAGIVVIPEDIMDPPIATLLTLNVFGDVIGSQSFGFMDINDVASDSTNVFLSVGGSGEPQALLVNGTPVAVPVGIDLEDSSIAARIPVPEANRRLGQLGALTALMPLAVCCRSRQAGRDAQN